MLLEILADDLPPQLMKYAMAAAPHIINYGWNVVSKTKPVKYLLNKLREVLGIDLNDDNCSYNSYNFDSSFAKNLDWSSLDP